MMNQYLKAAKKTWLTIVGVVEDSKHFRPTEPARPYFYMPFQQQYIPSYKIAFYMRATRIDPLGALGDE